MSEAAQNKDELPLHEIFVKCLPDCGQRLARLLEDQYDIDKMVMLVQPDKHNIDLSEEDDNIKQLGPLFIKFISATFLETFHTGKRPTMESFTNSHFIMWALKATAAELEARKPKAQPKSSSNNSNTKKKSAQETLKVGIRQHCRHVCSDVHLSAVAQLQRKYILGAPNRKDIPEGQDPTPPYWFEGEEGNDLWFPDMALKHPVDECTGYGDLLHVYTNACLLLQGNVAPDLSAGLETALGEFIKTHVEFVPITALVYLGGQEIAPLVVEEMKDPSLTDLLAEKWLETKERFILAVQVHFPQEETKQRGVMSGEARDFCFLYQPQMGLIVPTYKKLIGIAGLDFQKNIRKDSYVDFWNMLSRLIWPRFTDEDSRTPQGSGRKGQIRSMAKLQLKKAGEGTDSNDNSLDNVDGITSTENSSTQEDNKESSSQIASVDDLSAQEDDKESSSQIASVDDLSAQEDDKESSSEIGGKQKKQRSGGAKTPSRKKQSQQKASDGMATRAAKRRAQEQTQEQAQKKGRDTQSK